MDEEVGPVRVAVDASAASAGGGLSYLRAQLHALETNGVRMLILAQPNALRSLRDHTTTAQYVEVPSRRLLLRIIYAHVVFPQVAARWGADVIYCPGSSGPLFTRIPTVLCYQHPHLFTTPAPRQAALSALRVLSWLSALRSNAVIHISESMAAAFRATSALDVPITVLYSGPGSSVPAPSPSRPARPYILTVSNLYSYKRVDVVVEAFLASPYLRDNFDLLVAGDPMDFGVDRAIERLIAASGCGDRIRLLGFVEGSALSTLYANASVYVSASEREAFPLTPAEALLCGVPVVLSDIPVFRELYGEWASFCRIGDIDGFLSAIETAARAAPEGRAANALRERFSWEANAAGLADILRSTVSNGEHSRFQWDRMRFKHFPTLVRTVMGSSATK